MSDGHEFLLAQRQSLRVVLESEWNRAEAAWHGLADQKVQSHHIGRPVKGPWVPKAKPASDVVCLQSVHRELLLNIDHARGAFELEETLPLAIREQVMHALGLDAVRSVGASGGRDILNLEPWSVGRPLAIASPLRNEALNSGFVEDVAQAGHRGAPQARFRDAHAPKPSRLGRCTGVRKRTLSSRSIVRGRRLGDENEEAALHEHRRF